jgi:hypothetical protein
MAAGCLAGGLSRLLFLALALFLMLFGWCFDLSQPWDLPGLILSEEAIHPLWLPLPAVAWSGPVEFPVLLGGLLVFVLYLVALIDVTWLRKQLPKLVPAADPEPEPIPEPAIRRPV